MFRWQTWVGVAVGLVLGLTLLILTGGGRTNLPPPSGPILPECDGPIRELVIHYEPSARDIAAPVFRDFLRALENDITVHVVCPHLDAFADLSNTIGQIRCRLRPVVVGHPMTTWSRDRWVALSPAVAGGPRTLWSPRGEAADELWPARAGDERVGQDLAAALGPSVWARRSSLYFDGGDLLADGDTVFVVPRVLQRNLQHTVRSREELVEIFEFELKRRVVVLDASPDHHAGMFMMAAGHRTMLVGDPSLGRKFVPAQMARGGEAAASRFPNLPGGADFTPETQFQFDAVAAQCARAGYRVVRLPVVLGHDGRTYLTYSNVLVDEPDRQRVVYLPFYRGAEALNAAGRAVWESLGYEVRPVDCTSAYRHFGCLHCLVNVLGRGTRPATRASAGKGASPKTSEI